MAGRHGPVGQERNSIVWWLLTICLGIPGIYWIYIMWKEIAEFTKKDINPIVKVILMFIPLVNIYMIYTLYKEINEMEAMVGIHEGDRLNPIVNLILTCVAGIGYIFAQNHMNAVWKKA